MAPVRLDSGTVPRGSDWQERVNAVLSPGDEERLTECIRRDRPFGADAWTRTTAERLGLESSLRRPGRPRSGAGLTQERRSRASAG